MNAQEFSEKVLDAKVVMRNQVIHLIDKELESHTGLTDTEGFYRIVLLQTTGTGAEELIREVMIDRGFVDVEVLYHDLSGYRVKFKLPTQGE